jgi:hypothetical protein
MSVRVKFIGRLGNNLFQYAVGRIVAQHHGLALDCRQSRHAIHISVPPPTLENLAFHFPNAPLRMPGLCVDAPVESHEVTPDGPWNGQSLDLQSILADKTPRQIRLAGYFQRFEYFAPYSAEIRQWFCFKHVTVPVKIRANDILVNIRRGSDWGSLGWVLSSSYYDRVLSGLPNPGRFFVCGIGIDDEVRERLKKYRPAYFSGTPMEEFAFITLFNRIVLSNSTFAWWAAFLSHATEIYAPRSASEDSYSYTGYQDVDLHMQHPRYREIETSEFIPFAPSR